MKRYRPYPNSSSNGPYHSLVNPETVEVPDATGWGRYKCSLCQAVYSTKQWSGHCPIKLKEWEIPDADAKPVG